MPERTEQLYKHCPICHDDDGVLWQIEECPACRGTGYVPHGEAAACEDSFALDLAYEAMRWHFLRYFGKPDDVERCSESVEFTDPDDGRRFEIVVREIDRDDDDEPREG